MVALTLNQSRSSPISLIRGFRNQTQFAVYRVARKASTNDAIKAQLVMHIGPGDEGEAVATIMQIGED